uniref:Uncharacterized protein n=1 Tax=Anguilla anguilla TaxID=7936 RepID=A0A0E9UCE6_ANGAN
MYINPRVTLHSGTFTMSV